MSDLRKKSETDLKAMIIDLSKEAFNLRFQKSSGQLTNTSRVRYVRRMVARVKTLLSSETGLGDRLKTKSGKK